MNKLIMAGAGVAAIITGYFYLKIPKVTYKGFSRNEDGTSQFEIAVNGKTIYSRKISNLDNPTSIDLSNMHGELEIPFSIYKANFKINRDVNSAVPMNDVQVRFVRKF